MRRPHAFAVALAALACAAACARVGPARFADLDPVEEVADDQPIPMPRKRLVTPLTYANVFGRRPPVEAMDLSRTPDALDVGAHWNVLPSGRVLPVIAAHGGISLWKIPLQSRPDGTAGSTSGVYTPFVAATAAVRWIVSGGATDEKVAELGGRTAVVLTAGVRVEATLANDLGGHGAVFDRPVITVLPFLGMAFWRAGS